MVRFIEAIRTRLGWKTLTGRLVVLHTLLVLGVILVAGTVSYWHESLHIAESQEQQLRTKAVAAASLIGSEVATLKNLLRRIAESDVVASYRRTYHDRVLQRYFADYSDIFPSLSYTSVSGKEEVKVIRGATVTAEPRDLTGHPDYLRSQNLPNTVLISPPIRSSDLQTEVIELGFRLVDYFDEHLGYLQASVPLSRFSKVLSDAKVDGNGFIIIVDNSSRIIGAPDPELIGHTLGETDTDKELIEDISEGEEHADQHRLFGNDVMVIVQSVPELPWKVLVGIPFEDYYAPLSRLRDTLLIATLMLVVFGSLLAMKFGLSVAKPIRMLTALTREIATKGKLSQRLKWTADDEVGQLAKSFNLMLDQLQSSRQELMDSRQNIEDIFRSMADALIVTDTQGSLVRVNGAACTLLKYCENELLEMRFNRLLVQDSGKQLISDISENGTVKDIEVRFVAGDGMIFYASVSGALLRDAQQQNQGMVFIIKDLTERKQVEAHLDYMSSHDLLTGLPNRTLFIDRLSQAVMRSPWRNRLVAVLLLDVDRFKNINDTLGHETGDRLIRDVARRLTNCVREGDTVARLGGDEFAVLLNDVARTDDVVRLAEKLLNGIAEAFHLDDYRLVTTASIGVGIYPADGETPQLLLKNADTAMYRAKANGGNNFQLYAPEMNASAAEMLRLEDDLRRAFERDEFVLFYQPQVSLSTGRIIGVEALVRWKSPERGLVSPLEFLPLAEETGLIVPLGERLLYMACRQNRAWQEAGLSPVTVSVNIADRQFKYVDLPRLVEHVLAETRLPAQWLDLELTEGILMHEVEGAEKTLDHLKRLGVNLSIDDFGTGFSSLAHLKRFPIDTIKVDRSFIKDIPDDQDDCAITRAIIEMGGGLGLHVVAEGVEDQRQLEFLRGLGCEAVQGYYYSPPVPAEKITEMLRQGGRMAIAG